MKTIVSPSLLSANFYNLQDDIEMINRSDAEWLHLDIMDGVFVPNISFGFPVIEKVAKHCTKVLDAHFMIVHPEQYIAQTAKAGAHIMTVHVETCTQLKNTIEEIHKAGMKAGVALNPATPLSQIEDILPFVDLVVVMSVNPGFGGQKFNEQSCDKIRELRRMLDACGSKALIEIDGGINAETAPRAKAAGADVLVSGSYVFGAADPIATIKGLMD